MIAPNNAHEPTPEFAEYLARDIARTLRHEARFAPSAAAIRAKKLSVVMLSAVGTVVALAIGLVFGTSTGYASARVENDRQRNETAATTFGASSQLTELQLDLARAREALARLAANKNSVSQASLRAAESDLRSMEASAMQIQTDLTPRRGTTASAPSPTIGGISMKTALAVTCTALSLAMPPAPALAQQTIQTVTLPPASAKSGLVLWSVTGVHQVAGGKLVVNDQAGREVRVFDSTLTNSVVTVDSNAYSPRRPRALPLVAYLGDSSILPDPQSRTLRVIDGNGKIARTMSLPDGQFSLASPTYSDDKGRIYFSALPTVTWRVNGAAGDSTMILRVDPARGRVDTVARVKSNDGRPFGLARPMLDSTPRKVIDWLYTGSGYSGALVPSRDDWAVLSDGSLAIVRGHDYHVDWVRADGAMSSTNKLPFDWQRLADDNKKQAYDSSFSWVRSEKLRDTLARRVRLDSGALIRNYNATVAGLYLNVLSLTGGGSSSVLPDLDGNLWILPSASQVSGGEAVYDVVNGKGELTQRVRVPSGKTIAGFGRGGVVYLSSGDRQNGYYLERTKVPGSK